MATIEPTPLENKVEKQKQTISREQAVTDCKCGRIAERNLTKALNDLKWINHRIGDNYIMDGQKGWKIAYYPIFEDGKTGKKYDEPRALVEKSIEKGTDFREVPLRYLSKLTS